MPTDQPLPTFSSRTMKELAQQAEGKDWNKPEVVYEFSNGRKFESTDNTDSGIYESE